MKKNIEKLNVPKVEILKPSQLSKLKGGGVILETSANDAGNN